MPIVKLHVVLAGFFLTPAIVFAITGGLYTFSITGKYDSQSASVTLDLPADPGLSILEATAKDVIAKDFNGADEPSGKTGLKKAGTSWQFEWTGSRADFTLEPTNEPGKFKANYKRTTWHRFFVQLHKAKGGTIFKVLAGGLAVAFILIFLSGVLLALKNPRLKPLLFVSVGLGFTTFALAAFLS